MQRLIGNTPLVCLKSLHNVYAKLEGQNLSGSAKDRAALYMLRDLMERGLTAPGDTVIEATSGNTGVSLAALGAIWGLRAIIVSPDSITAEKKKLIHQYGAELITVPAQAGMAGAVNKAKEIAGGIRRSQILNQFENPANPLAHYCTTGPEIWAQTQGKIDTFVCGIGTGGTITGVGRYLKEKNPNIRIFGVEPVGGILRRRDQKPQSPDYSLPGLGAGFVPKVLDMSVVDAVVSVTGPQARQMSVRLARQEGILAGISAGAAVFAACEELPTSHRGETVVALLPDCRYSDY